MSKLKYYDGTEWQTVNGQITGDTLPIGAIIPYGSTNAPVNWLVCDGSAVSRTTYAELFAVIGTNYGVGDGSTTFNLPNYKGRVPVGYDSSDTDFDTIGEKGGSKALQEHTHSLIIANIYYQTGATNVIVPTNPPAAGSIETSTAGTGNSGNLQPYQVSCFIIKAFQSSGLIANVSNTQSNSQTDVYSCDYIEDNFSGKGILIWTNSNPSVEFPAQTLNFDSTYSYYDIISWVDGVTYETTRVYLNKKTIMQIMEGGFIRTRYANATNNSIEFSKGTFYQTYASGVDNNYQVIPYAVIGYK